MRLALTCLPCKQQGPMLCRHAGIRAQERLEAPESTQNGREVVPEPLPSIIQGLLPWSWVSPSLWRRVGVSQTRRALERVGQLKETTPWEPTRRRDALRHLPSPLLQTPAQQAKLSRHAYAGVPRDVKPTGRPQYGTTALPVLLPEGV